MTHLFRAIYYLALMIKEVILGKATILEAYRYDPRRVYILVLILFSIILNVFTVMALIRSVAESKEMRTVLKVVEKVSEDAYRDIPAEILAKYIRLKNDLEKPPDVLLAPGVSAPTAPHRAPTQTPTVATVIAPPPRSTNLDDEAKHK